MKMWAACDTVKMLVRLLVIGQVTATDSAGFLDTWVLLARDEVGPNAMVRFEKWFRSGYAIPPLMDRHQIEQLGFALTPVITVVEVS